MAVNEQTIDAPPGRVWAVLADPKAYAEWVVGSRDIHEEHGNWPEPGSQFVHTQGPGPLPLVKDTTQVIHSEEPHRLELEVRARPWLVGRVVLTLRPGGDGTHVRMEERATGGLLFAVKPLVDLMTKPRNTEALRRLRTLATRTS